jgi:hypothetical protein
VLVSVLMDEYLVKKDAEEIVPRASGESPP